MNKITLTKRLTYRYSTGYSYLDKSFDIGTARALGEKTIKRTSDFTSALALFLVSSRMNTRNVKRAFYDTLRSSCTCEHDCCGCISTSASKVRYLGNNLYVARINSYRNC